ncbi:MAG: DinB family protein, partial [Thermoanaerobaculia bacterium]
EELFRDLPRSVLTVADGTWSMLENAGHLIDLEALWDARLSDFLAGAEILEEADLSNRKTYLANHNDRDPRQVQVAFRAVRTSFLARFESLGLADYGRTSLHPRLRTPMRLIDKLAFIAEHDDHHLARILELRIAAGYPQPMPTADACGRVEGIHVSSEKGGEMVAVDAVRAVAGEGLEGDRYQLAAGTFSKDEGRRRQATLIEAEALEAAAREFGVELAAGESRRNITTRGVALLDLVGKEFTVGAVRMRGVKPSEPCGYLEKLTGKQLRQALKHRAGLKAEILDDGMIQVGDPVRV